MHRYNNMEFILTFDFDEVIEMYLKAKKENAEEKLWQIWLVNYNKMNKDNFTSFDDYKKESMKPVLKNVDVEEVLKDAEEIKRFDQSTH